MTGASEIRDLLDVLLRDAQPTKHDVALDGVDIVDARRRGAVGKLLQYRREDNLVGEVGTCSDEVAASSPICDRFLGNPLVEAFLAEQAQRIWLAQDPVKAMSDFVGKPRRGRPQRSDEDTSPFIAEVERLRTGGGDGGQTLSRDEAVQQAKDFLRKDTSFEYALKIYKRRARPKIKREAKLIGKAI